MSATRKSPPASKSAPAVLYGPSLPRGLKRVRQAPPQDPSFDIPGVEKPALLFYPEFCDGGRN
jgi:hypothetical protein